MKTCYLHLGLHKTASSSFQQTCAANIARLQQERLHYPIFSCPSAKPSRLKISNHSVPLRSLYEQNPAEYHINKRWKIKDIDSSTGWDAEHGYIRVNKNNELLRAQYFNWEILFKPLSFYTRRYY